MDSFRDYKEQWEYVGASKSFRGRKTEKDQGQGRAHRREVKRGGTLALRPYIAVINSILIGAKRGSSRFYSHHFLIGSIRALAAGVEYELRPIEIADLDGP